MDKNEDKTYSQEEVVAFGGASVEEAHEEKNTATGDNIASWKTDEVQSEFIEKSDVKTMEQDGTKIIDKISVISDELQELVKKVEQMNQLFQQKIAHTAHEEKIVDQMHSELQKYKQDMYAQLVRPVLMDIIEIRDSILRVSATFASKPESEQSVPLKTFSDYAYDVQDILEKNNITIYNSEEGEVFSPIKQRAVKKVTTPVEELHGKIAESLSSGYEYLGKTISPEKVVVYVYQKIENKEGDME